MISLTSPRGYTEAVTEFPLCKLLRPSPYTQVRLLRREEKSIITRRLVSENDFKRYTWNKSVFEGTKEFSKLAVVNRYADIVIILEAKKKKNFYMYLLKNLQHLAISHETFWHQKQLQFVFSFFQSVSAVLF